jgi:hypothetical protein
MTWLQVWQNIECCEACERLFKGIRFQESAGNEYFIQKTLKGQEALLT